MVKSFIDLLPSDLLYHAPDRKLHTRMLCDVKISN